MPFGRRALSLFIALPLLALVAGLATMGARAEDAPSAPDLAGGACTQHALKFGVTDDPAVVQRQDAFERTQAAVTAPGFYTRPTPATPTLHAAAHSFVVVFYRPDLSAEQLRPLRALAEQAVATKAPVVVAPRRQAGAVTALALGAQLTCIAADAAHTARVRAFAAAAYPSLKP